MNALVGMKRLLLHLMRFCGAFGLARRLTGNQVRILCYHGVWSAPGPTYGNKLFVSPEQFRSRLRTVARLGYKVIPLGAAIESMSAGTVADGPVVITIDDGWASTYSSMIPELRAAGFPATIYVTTWYVEAGIPILSKLLDYIVTNTQDDRLSLSGLKLGASTDFLLGPPAERAERAASLYGLIRSSFPAIDRMGVVSEIAHRLGFDMGEILADRRLNLMTPQELRHAHEIGFDIQLHTHRHTELEANVGALEREILDNRRSLSVATGKEPESFTHFCYPSGSFNPIAPDILKQHGIISSTTCIEGLNAEGSDPYMLKRFLDGRSVSNIEFEAYLAGVYEIAAPLRRLMARTRLR